MKAKCPFCNETTIEINTMLTKEQYSQLIVECGYCHNCFKLSEAETEVTKRNNSK